MILEDICKENLSSALEFALGLCGDSRTQSYPLHTAHQMKREFLWSIENTNGGLMGCYSGGALCGVFCYFAEPENLYLQTTGFYAASDSVFGYFLDYLTGKYTDYNILIGVAKENAAASRALEGHGFCITEKSADMRLKPEELIARPVKVQVNRITGDNIARYTCFHALHFNDGYWNAVRISKNYKDWDIYCVFDGECIVAGIYIRASGSSAEIYGMYAENERLAAELLGYSLDDVCNRHAGPAQVIYFVPEQEKKFFNAAIEAGFELRGSYCCWQKRPPEV